MTRRKENVETMLALRNLPDSIFNIVPLLSEIWLLNILSHFQLLAKSKYENNKNTSGQDDQGWVRDTPNFEGHKLLKEIDDYEYDSLRSSICGYCPCLLKHWVWSDISMIILCYLWIWSSLATSVIRAWCLASTEALRPVQELVPSQVQLVLCTRETTDYHLKP